MFDQDPWYFCQGQTTGPWVLDFVVQYAISIFVFEPMKVLVFAVAKAQRRWGDRDIAVSIENYRALSD